MSSNAIVVPEDLPGADLVRKGVADNERGIESVESLLVSIGTPRLGALGIEIRSPIPSAEHRLYALLAEDDPDSAHSRYNALVRRLVSFENAAEGPAWGPMRLAVDADIIGFMRSLGGAADRDGACYFAGGATAVLLGWRASTIDVVVKLVPESDTLLRAIHGIKEELQVNVELASPEDFIPVPPGWQGRSIFVATEVRLSFYHFDPYSQALGKLQRAHAQDLKDVRALLDRGLIEPSMAMGYFDEIEPELFRFPAIDPRTFRRRVEETFEAAP